MSRGRHGQGAKQATDVQEQAADGQGQEQATDNTPEERAAKVVTGGANDTVDAFVDVVN